MSLTKEQQAKKLFAEAWLKNPNDPYKAAMSCTDNNAPLAMEILNDWVYDSEVSAYKRQLLAERGHEAFRI